MPLFARGPLMAKGLTSRILRGLEQFVNVWRVNGTSRAIPSSILFAASDVLDGRKEEWRVVSTER